MFYNNLDPALFRIGFLEIRYYSLLYVFGFLTLYYMLLKTKEKWGITKKDVDDFIFNFMIGVVVGARLFTVIVWEPMYYLSDPIKIFYFWEGGMALHGGIIGAAIAVIYFCKKHKIHLWKFADFAIIPTAFFLAFGRIANFINRELVGTITEVPWCVEFSNYVGCRHPVQLYAAAGRFLIFGILLWKYKKKDYKHGYLFWLFIFLMGIKRFLTDFVRDDPRMLGLSMGQYLSLIMAIIGLYFLIKKYWKKS